jgi:hypothetical protein
MRWLRMFGLAVAGVAVFVAVVLGPDAFRAIPWGIRWGVGRVALWASAVVLVWRNPPRPWPLLSPINSPSQRWGALALHALTLTFAVPLMGRPGYSAGRDWSLHLQWSEAIRLSILRWGQFPWWNAWIAGGFPLVSDPQVGLVSIDTPLVLLFGKVRGLQLATVAYFVLAVEGARRLARLWFADPWAVAAAAAIYGWNGGIVVFTTSGHALTMAHPILPWVLLYAFQLAHGPREAVKLGLVAAAGVLTIVQYLTAYALMIAGVLVLWEFFAQPRGQRARYAALALLAAGVFLAVAGPRLVLTGSLVVQYPRRLFTPFSESPRELLKDLLSRGVPPPTLGPKAPMYIPELACYVGLIPVLAAVASVRRGWRWWHTLALAAFALAMGPFYWYQPSSWVRDWPVFSTMYMVGRWRLSGVLGLALAAASEVEAWRARSRWGRVAAAALVVWAAGDLLLFAHQSLPSAFHVAPSERHRPGPPSARIVNIEYWEFDKITQAFEATRINYGVIRGYSPLLGYDHSRRPTSRVWRGHPDYVGEFWVFGPDGRRPVEPLAWGPDRIELQVEPGQCVWANANPGSWWLANGRRAFPAMRPAEPTQSFSVVADAQGRLRLEVRPVGLGAAAAVSAMGLVLALGMWWSARRPRRWTSILTHCRSATADNEASAATIQRARSSDRCASDVRLASE